MKAIAPLAVALLVTGTLLAADAGKTDKALEGTWVLESVTDMEKVIPAPKDTTLTVTGNTMTFKQVDRPTFNATYKVDLKKKPKQIDLTFEKQARPAIYEVKGDTLRMALAEAEADPFKTETEVKFGKRPTAFDGKEKLSVVMIFKRKK